MVKIALDPTPYHAKTDLYGLFDAVVRAGYEWMHLSPHPDFIPFFGYSRVDDAQVARVKKAATLSATGFLDREGAVICSNV